MSRVPIQTVLSLCLSPSLLLFIIILRARWLLRNEGNLNEELGVQPPPKLQRIFLAGTCLSLLLRRRETSACECVCIIILFFVCARAHTSTHRALRVQHLVQYFAARISAFGLSEPTAGRGGVPAAHLLRVGQINRWERYTIASGVRRQVSGANTTVDS